MNKLNIETPAVAPNGKRIIGTLETIPGTSRATVTFQGGTELNVDYHGDTDMDWNGQQTMKEAGQRVFVDEAHNLWREDLIVEATKKAQAAAETAVQP